MRGVIHENVELSEALDCQGDHLSRRLLRGHVADERHNAVVVGEDRLYIWVDVLRHDPRPARREEFRGGQTDATGSTGDNYDFVFKVGGLVVCFRFHKLTVGVIESPNETELSHRWRERAW